MKPVVKLLLACLLFPAALSANGLRFHGSEEPIDRRTSYNVLGKRSVRVVDSFDISFDLSLYREWPIGYILRVKGGDNIYNLFFDGQGSDLSFSFNEEGRSSLIVARVDRAEMPEMQWTRVGISFDLAADTITISVGDRRFSARDVDLPDEFLLDLVFGRSDHIIDVPSFAIRDLSVGGDTRRWRFPLDENSGEEVHDSRGRRIGIATNPEWLVNDSFYWRFVDRLVSNSVAGALYDPARKQVLYFNRDTLYIHDVPSGDRTVRAFRQQCPVELALGTSFLHDNRLWAYEVFSEQPSSNAPSVASLDLETLEWRVESHDRLPTQLHHHSAWLDPESGRYTIFGGFGNMRFGRDFHSFDPSAGIWTTFPKPSGDTIWPRYFSSMGRGENGLYVFGGMGNESGEQIVGRQYFYDLHRVDLTSGTSTKLWEIPWEGSNVVPVRSMIVPTGEHFYTLCYPEHFSDSFLRLYRFSLASGSFEILGDSIPIRSDRITTNANLYYDEGLGRLFALVQEFDDTDIASELKIYSLAFPPVSAAELSASPHVRRTLVLIFGACVLASILVFTAFRIRRNSHVRYPDDALASNPDTKSLSRPNSVLLFGDFAVRDRAGRDISYMFSSRLRQTFCLILQHSLGDGDGISSNRLSDILWPDKHDDKAKNIRGVTLNHLRKVLGELDDVELVCVKGRFKIVHGANFYCDCSRLTAMLANSDVENNRIEFREIVSRGKFLEFLDDRSFDPFKNEVELLLESALLREMEKNFRAGAYQAVLSLSEALFRIDPLSDEALSFMIRSLNRLGMHDESRARYQSLASEYKKTIGVEYPLPFGTF